MTVIFLDLDGVLVTREELKAELNAQGYHRLNKFCTWLLNNVVLLTGAEIVLSSTWRITKDWEGLKEYLKSEGIEKYILDRTPRLKTEIGGGLWVAETRGAEIQAWLDGHSDVDKFVIVDDDGDMDHLRDHLVQTAGLEKGLEKHHAEEMLRRLDEVQSI